MEDKDKLITDVKGIAEILGISRALVYKLMKEPFPLKIPSNRFCGARRFHIPTVLQWVKDTSIRSQEDELRPYILPGRKRLALHD